MLGRGDADALWMAGLGCGGRDERGGPVSGCKAGVDSFDNGSRRDMAGSNLSTQSLDRGLAEGFEYAVQPLVGHLVAGFLEGALQDGPAKA